MRTKCRSPILIPGGRYARPCPRAVRIQHMECGGRNCSGEEITGAFYPDTDWAKRL